MCHIVVYLKIMTPNKSIGNYNFNLYHALSEFELEALDDRTEK